MKRRKNKREERSTYRLDDYRNKEASRQPEREVYQRNYNYYEQQDKYYEYTERLAESDRLREEMRKRNRLSKQESERRKERYKRRMQVRITLFICIAIVLTYAAVKIIDWFSYPVISYQAVQEGIIDNTVKRTGLIIRDEKVITSTRTGIIHRIIGQGEKVARGGQISFIADEGETAKALEAMNALDEQIYSLQEKRSDFSYYQSELYTINQAIKEELEDLYKTNYWEMPSVIYDIRSDLEKDIQERTTIYLQDETEFTESLQAGRAELQLALENYQHIEIAEESGIISYVIDGFERIGFENLTSFTYESYEEAMSSAENITLTANSTISSGDSFYKVIADDTWKIITYMDLEEAKAYETKKWYNFYFEGSESKAISFQLEYMIEEGEQVQCIFTTEDHMQTFLTSRSIHFVIGENREEGLKIPLQSIVEKNIIVLPNEYIVQEGREYGVLQVVGQNTVYTPINVQYTDDTHTYIMQEIDNARAIQLGDTIQKSGEAEVMAVDRVEMVQGVYVINGAYAKFKQIEIVMTNDDYAILSDNSNTKVKIFDQIISNPKNVQEEQLLKYMEVVNE